MKLPPILLLQVGVSKYSDSQKAVPYLSELRPAATIIHFGFANAGSCCPARFKRKGMKWYGWTEEQAQEEWDSAARDPAVKKKHDQWGNLVIAKLEEEMEVGGVRVDNKRVVKESNKVKVGDDEAITDVVESLRLSLIAMLQSPSNLEHRPKINVVHYRAGTTLNVVLD